MKSPLWALLPLMIAACSTLNAPDAAATLRAQNDAVVMEASAIRATRAANDAQVRATAVAAEIYVVQRNALNQQLLATVMVQNPPTQQQVVINPVGTFYVPLDLSGSGSSGRTPPPPPQTNQEAETVPDSGSGFAETVTARSIREQTDGCAESPVSDFSVDDERVYVVTRALQISAGTQIDVEWRYEGQPVDSTSWTVPQNEAELCIWFYLDSFSAGNWSVQLSANGVPITPAPSFTVSDAMAEGASGIGGRN